MLSRFRHVPLVRINEVTRVSASTDLTRYVHRKRMPQGYKTELMQYVITSKKIMIYFFYEKGVDVPTCPLNSHQKSRPFWTMQNQTIGHRQKS